MKKILVIGDAPTTPTGFSTVIFNVFSNLPKDEYQITQLGINYFGDPHQIPWDIYPASSRGDIWGFGRLPEFAEKEFDIIFILNDLWVLSSYLEKIRGAYSSKEKKPAIVVYFPVDAFGFDPEWFKNFDSVASVIVYTEFAKQVCKDVFPSMSPLIIPHGVDTTTYYKMSNSKEDIKRILYPNKEDFINSFIVLNNQRNQPRKRVDLTIEGFAEFAEDKPENVKLYLHMGLRDAGVDIIRKCQSCGCDSRLIITNRNTGIQFIPAERLNLIYNATDVGINTSIGEGWGLCNHEHAATGAPQIVPAHSACKELYENYGMLIPVDRWLTNLDVMTTSGWVRPEDVAAELQKLYENPALYKELSEKSLAKFTSEKYSWRTIANQFKEVFDNIV